MLLEILASAELENVSPEFLNEQQMIMLQDFTSEGGMTRIEAENLLSFADTENYYLTQLNASTLEESAQQSQAPDSVIPISSEKANFSHSVSVHPNPASETVTFTYQDKKYGKKPFTVYLLDYSGRTVRTFQLSKDSPTFEFNIIDLPIGVYTYSYRTKLRRSQSGRLVILR